MDIPDKYDGCAPRKLFTLQHSLQCKVGGLVTGRHNKVRDSLALMATQDSTSYSVRDKPIISSIWDGIGTKQPDITINAILDHAAGIRGDLQIRHLRQRQTGTIIDVRLTDMDAKSYISRPLDNVLEIKEDKIPPPFTRSNETLHTLRRLNRWVPWE